MTRPRSLCITTRQTGNESWMFPVELAAWCCFCASVTLQHWYPPQGCASFIPHVWLHVLSPQSSSQRRLEAGKHDFSLFPPQSFVKWDLCTALWCSPEAGRYCLMYPGGWGEKLTDGWKLKQNFIKTSVLIYLNDGETPPQTLSL